MNLYLVIEQYHILVVLSVEQKTGNAYKSIFLNSKRDEQQTIPTSSRKHASHMRIKAVWKFEDESKNNEKWGQDRRDNTNAFKAHPLVNLVDFPIHEK